tara:strand:- start:186 stop:404 length:219 start_codon:yes stop_codon:yes gene_type:complete
MSCCEWCGDTKDNLYDNSYGLFCDKICSLKDELEKLYYHKYNCTEKSNDKVLEIFQTKSYNQILKLIKEDEL